MPIGIKRINAKKSQPNERIVFIKPLKGPDEAIAQDFLERIAAQCGQSYPRRIVAGIMN
jgi:DNA-dependent metalloprotease WSS1